jgi:hypothetical protein
LRINVKAATLSCRRWSSTSNSSPSSSTARYKYMSRPLTLLTISSKCQHRLGFDRRRRKLPAIAGPTFMTQRRTVS